MKALLIASCLCLLPLPALAINKCVAADGHTTYTDEACPSTSKQAERLVEMPPPRPEDVQRAQDEAEQLKDKVSRAEARRASEEQKRARAEREAKLDRDRQELLELERRKVEALETQARANATPVPVIVVPERHAARPHVPPPPPTSQSQPRETKKSDTTVSGPKLPSR